MPYVHEKETVRPAIQAAKSRIERIHIRTPSDEDGNASEDEYSVVIEVSKFDDTTGKKLPETRLVKTGSLVEVMSLMVELPQSESESLDAFIKRVAYEFVVAKDGAPAGGEVS